MKGVSILLLLAALLAAEPADSHPFVGRWEYDSLRTADLFIHKHGLHHPLTNTSQYLVFKRHRHIFEFTATEFRSVTNDRDIAGAVEFEEAPDGTHELRLQAVCAPGWDVGTIEPTGTGFVIQWKGRNSYGEPLVYTRVCDPPTVVPGDPGSPPIPTADEVEAMKRDADRKLLSARKELDEVAAKNRHLAQLIEEYEAAINEHEERKDQVERLKFEVERLKSNVLEAQNRFACQAPLADITGGLVNLTKRLEEVTTENARLKKDLAVARARLGER